MLKAKFADIKEAYEILRDPVKRRKYNLTFDNFSWKKEVHFSPYQLLQKAKDLRIKTGKLDPHRMDLDRLEFEITELLSERNTATLANTEDTLIVQQFIEELLEAARPLNPGQLKPITDHLSPLANEATREKMKRLLQSHARDNRWNNYKIAFAIAAGILLCLLIYFLGK